MKRVRRKDTEPELAVRRFLHAAGFRYTLHDRRLPGKPDLVLPRRRAVVFVHGCFWHAHDCPHGRVRAVTNTEFWEQKLHANRERDARKARELSAAGWHVEIVWECQVHDLGVLMRLADRLRRQVADKDR